MAGARLMTNAGNRKRVWHESPVLPAAVASPLTELRLATHCCPDLLSSVPPSRLGIHI